MIFRQNDKSSMKYFNTVIILKIKSFILFLGNKMVSKLCN